MFPTSEALLYNTFYPPSFLALPATTQEKPLVKILRSCRSLPTTFIRETDAIIWRGGDAR